jgi:hypothetical protein
MRITRCSSIETAVAPGESFTGTVYLDPAVGLDGVSDGSRAMNDREAIKVMVEVRR